MIALTAGSCGVLALIHTEWRSEAQAQRYQQDEVCQYTISCSHWFLDPDDPDAVFELITLNVPILVSCDSTGLVSDTLDPGPPNSLAGCRLVDCSARREEIISLKQLPEPEEEIQSPGLR
jgi:hypothetical protein